MALLRGIETLAIGRTSTVELSYEGSGQYVDREGNAVKIEDVACYECLNSMYVLASEPIDYCPHCGYRTGKAWPDYEAARSWAMKHDFAYMRALGRVPFGVRRGDGSWLLAFAKKADELLRSGDFVAARELVIDDREVAETDAVAGFHSPGRQRAPSAFGGGGDETGGRGDLEID